MATIDRSSLIEEPASNVMVVAGAVSLRLWGVEENIKVMKGL